ncbi:hypothetical protein [Pseudoalteromonas luteoviolacea]|uniref:Uncharacterized protein n=1 Tax=Pseudoalteromonas luteoviolacea S4054 TaxID=1129367 RepID=A0A0F6A7L0_9GAMM|nr:hypothetical protein [Pseudoalteromonas luteoviolacea]AOT10400.1 hypothetical protein S4054249_21245 [Pseudoalteromonas luteoviolacea]AOT15530.1 hypothetical protein S40542_22345 [Pseudoalteromonas luteoviolacea]AOT20219.1 hypothetical protein S4054_21160 [Pseudoalteromonas luteoviolacea]KKE82165.1 hypothetical protein N479_19370 [Pseudoalteromonas luteoviolacea S4054]KZN69687.1 hypothetical protein N481_21805 [Pseudoalteromonas luteoviolacea S4047-1]
MIQKIAGWALIISGVVGLGLTGYFFFKAMELNLLLVFLFGVSVLPIVSGIYTLKNQRWALWVGLLYFLIQVIRIETSGFSWSFESPISFYIALTHEHTHIGFNLFAAIMLVIFIKLLRAKSSEVNTEQSF